jgi:uncharacterized protein involved in exopolysaccharide biosynthesis
MHLMSHGGGGFLGGLLGLAAAFIPFSSHVEDSSGFSTTGMHMVDTNIFGSPVGTNPVLWITVGAILGILAQHWPNIWASINGTG